MAAIVLGALLAALALAPAAAAQSPGVASTGCGSQQLSQPFTQWGDQSSYFLAPGGSFESGPAWSTSGGAQVVSGNEPWQVNGSSDNQSLSLPPGSSATSRAMCLPADAPTIRFFASSTGGGSAAYLEVDVVYNLLGGNPQTMTIGQISPTGGSWTPTVPLPLTVNATNPMSPGHEVIELAFIPHGGASWQVDDVYVDPWSKG